MKTTSNENPLALLKFIIWEDLDAYVHLSKYKNCGEFTNKPVFLSGCASAIESSENNGSSDQITE